MLLLHCTVNIIVSIKTENAVNLLSWRTEVGASVRFQGTTLMSGCELWMTA